MNLDSHFSLVFSTLPLDPGSWISILVFFSFFTVCYVYICSFHLIVFYMCLVFYLPFRVMGLYHCRFWVSWEFYFFLSCLISFFCEVICVICEGYTNVGYKQVCWLGYIHVFQS